MDVQPLTTEYLHDAAALLAKRQMRERSVEPLLPVVDDYRGQIEHDLDQDGAVGAIAVRGGDVVADLVGPSDPDGVVRVDLAGMAATEPEGVRDVYSFLASEWRRRPAPTRSPRSTPECGAFRTGRGRR